MAFNLSYADKGADLSDAGSNFKTYAKAAKAKDATKQTPKEDPKKPKAASDTTKPAATESPATKLMGIINKNGGSPTQSVNPADKPVTLEDVVQGNPLTKTDSLNINIGLVHNYQQSLGKQLVARGLQEGQEDMDKELEDPNYLSLSRKNDAAMELRDALLNAKKRGVGMESLKLSPIASALHSGFINQAANKLISENKYQPYLTVGAGLNIK